MTKVACEFCCEFSNQNASRFSRIYKNMADTRVIARTENFVAVPTLGQLFEGSLLILPISHIESSAAVDTSLREELCHFVYDSLKLVAKNGSPIFFEHGATERTGGGCGIYHAHIHLVPLPSQLEPCQLLPEYQKRSENLKSALNELGSCTNYLLVGNEEYTLTSDITVQHNKYPSQYFRKVLAKSFNLNKSWDWREYQQPEVELIATLNSYRGSNVPLG